MWFPARKSVAGIGAGLLVFPLAGCGTLERLLPRVTETVSRAASEGSSASASSATRHVAEETASSTGHGATSTAASTHAASPTSSPHTSGTETSGSSSSSSPTGSSTSSTSSSSSTATGTSTRTNSSSSAPANTSCYSWVNGQAEPLALASATFSRSQGSRNIAKAMAEACQKALPDWDLKSIVIADGMTFPDGSVRYLAAAKSGDKPYVLYIQEMNNGSGITGAVNIGNAAEWPGYTITASGQKIYQKVYYEAYIKPDGSVGLRLTKATASPEGGLKREY